jgi:autotransporter-associated beta strand protein
MTIRIPFALRSSVTRLLLVVAGVALCVCCIPVVDEAATLTWDPGLTPGSPSGGTGTWDLNITPDWSNGSNDVNWTDSSTAGTDTAIFSGTAGTVTLNSNLSAAGLQFLTSGYTITGANTLTLGASGIDASQLSSGVTTINAGLSLGGILQSWNVGSGSLLSVGGSVNLGASTNATAVLTDNGSGNITISGNISGTATNAITLSGSGRLTLSGNSNYSGVTAISGNGTLVAASTTAFGTGNLSFGATSTGTLDIALNNGSDITNSITSSSGATVTLASDLAAAGVGVNHTLGSVVLGFGTLNIVQGANVTSGTASLTFNLGLTSGTTNTTLLVNPTTANALLGTVSITANANNKTVDFDGTSSGNTVSGIISNGIVGATLSVIKSNSSNWTFSGANTFTGGTQLNSGTLHLANSLALQSSALNLNGGTLVFDSTVSPANFTIGGLSGSSSLALQNSASAPINLTLNVVANQTYTSSLSGTGAALTKSGTAGQIFNAPQSYTGGTTISGGLLEFGGQVTNMPGTGTISVGANSILAVSVGGGGEYTLIGSGAGTIPGLLGNGTTGLGGSNNTITYAAGAGVGFDTNDAGGNLTYGGTLPTGFSFAKLGANSLVLTSANFVSGSTSTTVSGGALQLGNANALAGSALTISSANGLTFSPGIGTFNVGSLAGASNETLADTSGGAVTLSVGANNATTTYSGILSGVGGLTVVGNGNLILTAANTYAGGTVVNSGATLNLARPNAGNTGAGTIAGTLTINSGGTVILSQQNALGYTFNDYVNVININQGGVLNDTFTGASATDHDNGVFNTFNLNGGTLESNNGTPSNVTGAPNLVFNGGLSGAPAGTFVVGSVVNVLANATTSSVLAGQARLRGTAPNTIFNVADGAVSPDLLVSAALVDTGAYYKTGPGLMSLTGPNTNTGTAFIAGGTLLLSGTGSSSGTSTFEPMSGTFKIDNTGTNNNTRIAVLDTIAIAGGTFFYQGTDAASTNSTQTIATINGPGNGVLTIADGGTNSATLTAGTLAHAAGNAAFLVNGVSLGKDNTSVVPRVKITTAPILVGTTNGADTGNPGLGVALNTKIVPFLLGEATVASGGSGTGTGTPNTFVTWNANTGLRPLNLTDEFKSNQIDVTTTGDNTYITSATNVAATTAVNSLVINGGNVTINDGITLTNSSGAILFASNNNIAPTGTTGILALASEGMITTNAGVNATISTKISGAVGLTKGGPGTLTLSGVNTFTGATTVSQGTVNITGSSQTSNLVINPTAGNYAIVSLSNTMTAIPNGNTISVGTSVSGFGPVIGTAVLNILPGTVISGGNSPISAGNAGGYGVINMSGGSVTPGQFLVAGIGTNSGAIGVWNISGGSVTIAGNNAGTIGASADTTGILNISGTGNYTSNTGSTAGIFIGEDNGNQSGALGIVNMSGSGTMVLGSGSTSSGLRFGVNSNGTGIANLGAVGSVIGVSSEPTITTNIVQKNGGSGTFNFHGGTLKAQTFAATATFFTGLTNAYVYGEGGVIDNNGANITIGQALLAPTGNGITNIATSGGTGYVAAPYVSITGGGGFGATAIANIDINGNLTGITMTNPGVGYTSTPTITFTGGNGAGVSVGAITLASNVSGGLTFKDTSVTTSTTTLTANLGPQNNLAGYTGPTNINSGILALTGAGAINSSSSIIINGSTAKLQQNSSTSISIPVTLTSGALAGSGSIANTVTVANSAGNIIANGNGNANDSSQLNISSLVFSGAATMNLTINASGNSSSPAVTTTTLDPIGAGGTKVLLNLTNAAGVWNSPGTYDLIGYSTLTGAGLGGFVLNNFTPSIGGRTSATLTLDNNNIAVQIAGDNPVWTGLVSTGGVANWTALTTTPSPKNWRLITAQTSTDYIQADVVLFDDTASNLGGVTNISISDANVTPTSVTFNNNGSDYTINGPFGIIDQGAVHPQVLITGSRTVTLASPNAYSGGTTIGLTNGTGGSVNINNNTALGTGPITFVAANTATQIDNTSNTSVTLTNNNTQTWSNDLNFVGSNPLNMGTGAVTITGNRTITVGSGALNTTPGVVTIGGNISDAGQGFGITLGASNTGSPMTGTLVLNGTNTYTGPTAVNGGTLTLTGSLGISPASNAGQITVNNLGFNSVVNFTGANVNLAFTGNGAVPSLGVGNSSSGTGAVYQTGGTVTLPTTQGSNLQLGFGSSGTSFGYYSLAGGGLLNLNEFDIGGNNVSVNGNGVMDISSGTINVGAWITMSRGQNAGTQTAILNMTGGTINIGNVGGGQISMAWGGTDTSVINITNAQIIGPSNINYVLDLNRTGTANLGEVNLNANGVLQIGNIVAGTAVTPSPGANVGAFLNFNGGTLKATTTNGGNAFLTNANISGVYVYSGGGTIDNNSTNITIGRQLLAPTGNGIADSVFITNGGSGYVSPPAVTVNGDGTGAAAVATVVNGVVTGIHITNPGVGYTSASFSFTGGGGDGNIQYNTLSTTSNTSGGMTFLGSGTTTITANNTYTGTTTINGGTVRLNTVAAAVGGTFNGSSGINVIGSGKLVQVNTTTAVSPTVTLTNGTLDGTGLVNNVVVVNGNVGTVTNGNGTFASVTIGSLIFQGTGTISPRVSTATTPGIVTTTLTSSGGANSVTVSPTNTSWANGQTYDLVSYTTLSGSFSNFILGSVTGLSQRQNAVLVNPSGFIALSITGDLPVWTGIVSNDWTTNTIPPNGGGNKNWKLQTAGTPTDFLVNDTVVFDDSATSQAVPGIINIGDANVSPTSTTFSNATSSYTLSSTGGFGIATGSLTKNNNGIVNLNTANTYSGGTTLNGGALNLNNASAIGTGPLTITGGALNSISGTTLSTNNAQFWNGDFSFTGTTNLTLGTGAVSLGGSGTSRTVTVNAGQLGVGSINESSGATLGLTVAGPGTLVIDSSSTNNPNGGGAQSNIAGILNVTGNLDIASPTPVNAANAASDMHVGGLTGSGTISNGGGIVRWLFVNETDINPETFSGVLQNGGSAGLGLTKSGTGVLNLTNVNTYTDVTTVAGGTLNVASTGAITSSTGAQIIVGNTASVNAVLKIAGSVSANDTAVGQFGSSLIVGTVANAVGAVQMTDGTLTAAEQIGLGNGAVTNATLTTSPPNNPYAGFLQTGGNATAGSFVVVGFNNDRSVYSMSGNSTLTLNSNLITIAAGGTGAIGEMDLSGNASVNSTATTGNAATIGGIFVGEVGSGILNVSGNASMSLTGWGLRIGHNAGATGTVNLDGGVVTTVSVSQGGGAGIINFNGGTLKAAADNTAFMPNLTTATIHGGGLTIDTNGHAITVAQPLLAPAAGFSLTDPTGSITVSGGGFIAPPQVVISGGSGSGASAIANIDSNGNLTGITITNPGTGYANSDLMQFSLVGGGVGNTGSVTTNFSNVTPTVTTGGLTKVGAGTLTLTGVNTYGGSTTINQGTLALGVQDAITATSHLALAGGTFSTGGFSQNMANTLLDVSSSSAISLGATANTLNLADSHGESWGLASLGSLLRINNWTPSDLIIFPTASALTGNVTSGQLGDIHFTGFLGTSQLVNVGANEFELEPANPNIPLLLGDLNGDGHVDARDIITLEKALINLPGYESNAIPNGRGTTLNNADLLDIADMNADGKVTNTDVQSLLNYLLNGHGSNSPVPEPESFVLLALGGLVAGALRSRKKCVTIALRAATMFSRKS